MSKFFQRCTILFLCIILLGCSGQPRELKIAESLIETAPDSALHILQSLSPGKYKWGANRALYGLLMIQTLDKKLLPLKPESLLDYSISYYEQNNENDRLASCYLYKGRTYKYAFQYEKASNCYLKALDEAKNSMDNTLLGRINFDMGDICLYQREYEPARENYMQAYHYFSEAKQTTYAHYSLIYIGKTYSLVKLYKKAQPYLYKVYKESKDSTVINLALQNIGVNYYYSKQFDSALVYLRMAIHNSIILSNYAIQNYYLADLFLDMNEADSACYYASKVLNYNPDIRTKRECYRILANTAKGRGYISKVKKFMANYQECSDSIRKIDAQTKGTVLKTIHTTKQEMDKTKSKLFYVYIFLLLVTLLFVFIYYLKHKQNKEEKQRSDKIHSQKILSIRKEDLLKKSDTLLKKVEEKKVELAEERKKANQLDRELQIKNIYSDLIQINDLQVFHDEMDVVLNMLVTKLKTRYRGLTTKELTWCCLYLLKIPTHDILILLDYKTDNSLKRMKNRLSEKLNLENATQLSNFLNAILSES